MGEERTILSKNEELNTAEFEFSVAYTGHLKQAIYLRIYNITWEDEKIFECYYTFQNNKPIEYDYSIQLANSPICIQHTRNQHSIPGANTSIGIHVYSKPKYLTIYYRKDDNELDLKYNSTVSEKNISLDIYNVTVTVGGYEIIIKITEFSEEDVGNYTVDITNEFGYSNCTVRLLPKGKQ
ncbi:unnamed protein product [Mytilus coruscus]|uniref:Immunoglobulin subtype domain-containing protein n=1 Tax=Mytilus coruscus TaxID=42192 RepID=A0A6J8DWE5_MYTCO|nr:unnamed protein product [Mytilus coruscus]